MLRKLDLMLFGPFGMNDVDPTTSAPLGGKAQGLLAYLAMEPRSTRDRVASLFWGELSEERARHNLRQALSKIRRICGPVIASDGDRLCLDSSRCSIDVTEFLHLAEGNDEQSLEKCIRLYTGELLEGAAPKEPGFEEWLLLARDRLRNLACETMDRYVQLLIAGEQYERAIAALNRRLEIDPACEPAHRDLMIVLARVGRRSDALRQYELCAAVLKRELGVTPSPELEQLLASLRRPGQVADTRTRAATAVDLPPESGFPKVAVLPFENLSGPPDDYFVDGITEDIITALSRFHSLQVIARSSTFVYRNNVASDHEIAAALDAPFIVRGSVRRAGDRLRLSVQLLNGPARLTLWANRFDREMTDVFRVQDEITATLVSTLAGRVEATELERARKATRQRLQAYDYLLRGKDHHHRFTADDCETCIEMFSHAIDHDPAYAVAYAWLACGLGQAMVWRPADQAALVNQAQAAAERGLELDQNESECHRILAQVRLARGNLPRALKHQERALFLNPNDDRSICSMGEILCYMGRHEEAEQWVRKSLALNPYHPQRYWTHLARPLFHLGRAAEALDVLEQIGRPRQDDLLYAIAASAEIGDEQAIRRNIDALRIAYPEVDAGAFVTSLPYMRAADRDKLRGALVKAGVSVG